MKSSLYTVFYAAALGVVCAGLLTGVGAYTRPFRESNEEAERVRNILAVLDVEHDAKAPAEDLVRLFEETAREGSHKDVSFFVRVEGGAAKAVAFAFKGRGLWGPIEGFLALEPDLLTIRGVTFHKHKETPGLGGEIEKKWFRERFKGTLIRRADGSTGLKVLKAGSDVGPGEVDGIIAATMTCERVEVMLNAIIARILDEKDAFKAAIDRAVKEVKTDA